MSAETIGGIVVAVILAYAIATLVVNLRARR